MNPYTVNAPRLSHGLKDWQALVSPPVAGKQNPLRRARLMLAASILEDVPTLRGEGEFMRQAALIRRVEWQERLNFLSLLPHEPPCQRLLTALFMLTELTASAAQQEEDACARAVMDFLLPENCDMLYRTANLLSLEYGVSADALLCSLAELIPGRPCIAAHRHPYDDVQPPLPRVLEQPGTFVNVYALRSAARSVSRMAAGLLTEPSAQARSLYAELSLILSEHATQYDGLLSQQASPQLRLLLHTYACCCVFGGLERQEEEGALQAVYHEAWEAACAHLHKARSLCPAQLRVPFIQADAPNLPILRANKGYIRGALRNIGVTLRRGERLPVGSLPEGADFFRYQKRMNADLPRVPSHAVVTAHILKKGQDFRSELAPHPVELMRNRAVDQVRVGR